MKTEQPVQHVEAGGSDNSKTCGAGGSDNTATCAAWSRQENIATCTVLYVERAGVTTVQPKEYISLSVGRTLPTPLRLLCYTDGQVVQYYTADRAERG